MISSIAARTPVLLMSVYMAVGILLLSAAASMCIRGTLYR